MKRSELKRKSSLARAEMKRKPMAAKAPAPRPRRPPRFRDPQMRCRAPDCTAKGVHQHHVVYQQHVAREGGDEWDGDNALSLCVEHHAAHHHRMPALPRHCLRPENVAFARALLAHADDYLARYYA